MELSADACREGVWVLPGHPGGPGRGLPAARRPGLSWELAGDLAVSPDILWSDWLTRELYGLPDLGITTVTTAFSRFVADVNRDPAGEQHGRFSSASSAGRCRTTARLPPDPDVGADQLPDPAGS